MEPPDEIFSRSFRFLDQQGMELGASMGGISTLSASGRRTRRGRVRVPSTLSVMTHTSNNTLLQSVLAAEGLVDTADAEKGGGPNTLPERYKKGSAKAKLTWFGALCLEGIGMFVEAYVIITTGQVKTVWHDNYPTCWDFDKHQPCPNNIQCCGLFPNTPSDMCNADTDAAAAAAIINPDYCDADNTYRDSMLCTERRIGAVSYAEFGGIMAGMLAFGYISDAIGRKRAGTLTALLMIAGIGGMTFFGSDDLSTQFLTFAIFFGIFGLGVGGEYPLTASQAAEHHAESYEDALEDDQERRHQRILMEQAKTKRRGETISLVFAMQGLGAVVGSIFLLAMIYFSNQTRISCDSPSSNSRGDDPNAVESIWRNFYFVGLIFVLMLLAFRFLVLEEGEGYSNVQARRERRERKLGKNIAQKRYWETFRFYTPRLIGTGGNWLVWDVTFYGLKLFSGPIFEDINPGGDLVVQNGYLLVNNLCALAGYYCAAALIDHPSIGRKRLQMFSFLVNAALFMTTAAVFSTAPTGAIITLYFLSSFFGQCGANVTTYVMAAETFPTELRGTFHGLSSFLGKMGALVATIGFSYLSTEEIFWVCGGCAIAGFVFTLLFSSDLTGVSLAEQDAQLEFLYAGQLERYKGKLNKDEHLSNFERWTGRHGVYDQLWVKKLARDEKTKPTNLFSDIAENALIDENEEDKTT